MTKVELGVNAVVAFDGDSLTALRSGPTNDQWPWLRISNNHRSWADVFAELLFAWRPELNLKFRTVAVGGSTCRSMMARFDATMAVIKPGLTFLTLGSNDATQAIPVEEFERTLRDYCGRIGAWGGRVVFVYGFRPCPNAGEATIAKAPQRLPYYEVEERLARELPNVRVVDVGDAMLAKAELLYAQYPGHDVYSDGVHFSNLGAMIVAGEVLRACGVVV